MKNTQEFLPQASRTAWRFVAYPDRTPIGIVMHSQSRGSMYETALSKIMVVLVFPMSLAFFKAKEFGEAKIQSNVTPKCTLNEMKTMAATRRRLRVDPIAAEAGGKGKAGGAEGM